MSVEALDILLANAPPNKIVGALDIVLAPQGEMPSRFFLQPPPLRKLGGNPRDEGMTAVGERTGNGSRRSCFHTTAPENQTDYFTVRMELISGTPNIQALISGFRPVFIVDTGSSISLIQSRVYLSDVSPTNLSPFGVTGNQKYKRHSK